MTNLEVLAGWISLALGIVGYASYITGILKGRVHPHAFSWGVWGLMATLTFLGQHVAGAGPGSWVIGLAAVSSFLIFFLCLKYGEPRITRLDGVMLGVGVLSLLLWVVTKDPMLSVVLAVSADVIGGSGPTLRKAYDNPWTENPLFFMCSVGKYIVALVALSSWNLTTLFPLCANLLTNGVLLAVILVRRRQVLQREVRG